MSQMREAVDWRTLSQAAWRAREHARILGNTKVGASVLDETSMIHVGCNLEHRFRSHDIHAEVNALSSMVAAGARRVVAVFVAAERDSFTPCGSCMDWIMELGGPETVVAFQATAEGPIKTWRAGELMPHYPK